MSKNNWSVISDKTHRGLFAFIIAALISTSAYDAQAVVFMWNNTGSGWTTATSWQGGTAPSSNNTSTGTDEVQFGSVGPNNNTVVLTSTRDTQTITFLLGANAYNINSFNGTQLLTTRLGMANNSTATQTFGIVVQNANASNTWTQVTGGSMVFNNNVGLSTGTSATSRILTLAGGGTFTFNAGMTQANSTGSKLTVNNAGGVVNLNAANAMGGATGGGIVLTAGQVNISNAQSLGTGIIELGNTTGAAYGNSILNNASGNAITLTGHTGVLLTSSAASSGLPGNGIQFGTADSRAANNIDFGSAVVTATASRQMNIAGSGVTISMGRLDNTSATAARTFTFDGAGNTLLLRGFKITTAATAATSANLEGSANLEIAGVIENGNLFANGVVLKGTGAKTFSGANTYTGETEIASGATLNYGANDVTLDTGGRMYVNGGTLNIGSYSDTVSSVRVNAGGAINGTGTLTTTGTFTLSDNNVVNANLAGAMTISKSGAGLESLLNGNNTYSGTTTVNSGTLKLGSNTALGSTGAGTTTSSGGFLDLNGKTVGAEALTFTGSGGLLNSSGTAASLSGNVAIGDSTTVNTTADITLSGNLTGTSSKILTKEGAGILKLSSSGSTLAGTLKVSAGTLLVTSAGNVSTSTSIVDGGTLRVNGTAGGVTVNNGGSLEGAGTVGAVTLASGSFLKPGNSPGTLFGASSIWQAGSTYSWEIDSNASSAAAGTNWDLFSVTGVLDLSALNSNAKMNLVLNSLSGFDLTSSTRREWVIAKAGSFTGNIADNANLTDLFNIDTANFNGGFQVVAGTDVNLRTLNLMAVIPEPSTGSLLAFGLGGLVVTRLLRRKQS